MPKRHYGRVRFLAGLFLGAGGTAAGVKVGHEPQAGGAAREPVPGATQSTGLVPDSHHDLLRMVPGELEKVDIAMMNLLCSKGLPGAENFDIPSALKKLDEWTAKVKFETQRHLYRAKDPRWAEHYKHSEARLRAEFIVMVLQEDCGVHYNVARIRDIDFSNSKDMFLLGMIGSNNDGTCASMPVMYVAVGRRLGYPMKLVAAKTHLFCRWDGAGERFNIDGATNGGVSYFEDEHYRKWPEPITDTETATGRYLQSFTPTEELGSFLISRGACLQSNRRLPEAMVCFSEAYRLMPNAAISRGSLLEASTLVPVDDIEIFARQARAKGMRSGNPPADQPNLGRRRAPPLPPGVRVPDPMIDLTGKR